MIGKILLDSLHATAMSYADYIDNYLYYEEPLTEGPLTDEEINSYYKNKGTVKKLRFLYNRLALVINCDSHLSSINLPWQLLSVIKVVFFHQILLLKI